MRILVLTPTLYDSAPGPRFRIEQWSRYLEKQGYHFTFLPFEGPPLHDCLYQHGHLLRKSGLMASAMLRRLSAAFRISEYDLVFVYREAAAIGPAFLERLIAYRRVPLVFDFDDPVWIPYRSPVNQWFTVLKSPGKTASICRLASVVIAGNHLLAEYASRYSRTVNIVPSTIDMHCYPGHEGKSSSKLITLGWTGSHSTIPFLERLIPNLRRLAQQRRFRLVVISHTDSYTIPDPGFEVISRRWNSETEAHDLADIDIGLAPFPNTGWTPWRCHGKVLQYMAASIPCVASPIGIIPDYIQEGVNGYLASGDEAWRDRIIDLMDHPAFRKRMGAEGRKTIETRYSAALWAPKVAAILNAAAKRTPS